MFHVTAATIASWMKRVDQQGPLHEQLLRVRAQIRRFRVSCINCQRTRPVLARHEICESPLCCQFSWTFHATPVDICSLESRLTNTSAANCGRSLPRTPSTLFCRELRCFERMGPLRQNYGFLKPGEIPSGLFALYGRESHGSRRRYTCLERRRWSTFITPRNMWPRRARQCAAAIPKRPTLGLMGVAPSCSLAGGWKSSARSWPPENGNQAKPTREPDRVVDLLGQQL